MFPTFISKGQTCPVPRYFTNCRVNGCSGRVNDIKHTNCRFYPVLSYLYNIRHLRTVNVSAETIYLSQCFCERALTQMIKIYDCFLFFNELELLDLRLSLTYDYVDYFVLVESNKTFSGLDKPYVFANNLKRYSKYLDKIIYLPITSSNQTDPWSNEKEQRNSIVEGLKNVSADDVIIISDVDEIIRPTSLLKLRESSAVYFGFRVPHFNFKYNYLLINNIETYMVCAVGVRYSQLEEPDSYRRLRFKLSELGYQHHDSQCMMLEHAGWHFSFLGDEGWIRTKIKSFSHQELNTEQVLKSINIDENIRRGVGFNSKDGRAFVSVIINDDYFPTNLPSKDCVLDATDSIYTYL